MLARSELTHHLDSLTQRNQHQDFEVFARKLCEREICPNLRPQTGPEGGGDGKVDTETYPVADEISDRWLYGLANTGEQRWGFAVSAKEKWAPKVRSDVKGMIETGRAYDRITFITSRPVRSKDRHRVEDELSEKYGVRVIIHDRSWIVERVFENKHQDLAYEYLKAGRYDESKVVIGPLDYERMQELDGLEERLAESGQSGGELTQSVVDALEAAQLSRMLERPRIETAGRFERAIKLAEKHGTRRQRLLARYERAWGILWWFDEPDAINEDYELIEEIAFADNLAEDVSKLSNLYTVLSARVSQGWETAEELNLEPRRERLEAKIREISLDTNRPNNALYGQTLGLLQGLSNAYGCKDADQLDEVWKGLGDVIDQAHGLGEFPADLIDQVTEALQPYAPESESFDSLVLKLAEFMGERAKEGKAGRILFLRGEQRLEAEEPIEAIRWLGKASVYFMKEEYAEEQYETLSYLSIAYKSAGLLWAARATSLSALVRMIALSDGSDGPRPELIPAANLFAMISLQLGRFVDFLTVILWLKGLHHVLPLSDEGRDKLADRLQEFDRLLMCLIVNLGPRDLETLSHAPDILDELQLYSSRMMLLLLLGHADVLKHDGSMPEDASADELLKYAEMAAIQPAARDLPKQLIMYQNQTFECSTILLGVKIEFSASTSVLDHLLCEAHIAALEGFLATAVETGVFAHAASLSVTVQLCNGTKEPEVIFDPDFMNMIVKWPLEWDITDVAHYQSLCDHLIYFCAKVIDAIAIVASKEDGGFMSQIVDELVIQRSISFSNACFGNHRLFGTHASTLTDLVHLSQKEYPLLVDAPTVQRGDFLDGGKEDDEGFTDPEKTIQHHGGYAVESIINIHLWNDAGWNGMLFGNCGPQHPPILAFIFDDERPAKSIFTNWKTQFGDRDDEDLIRLTLIQGINAQHETHYRAAISKNFNPDRDAKDPSKKYMQATRMLTMEPSSSQNLDAFLRDYSAKQCFLLAPAVLRADGQPPELLMDHTILKRRLYVRQAWEIGLHDQDSIALRDDDNISIPPNVEDPPCFEIFEFRRSIDAARQ